MIVKIKVINTSLTSHNIALCVSAMKMLKIYCQQLPSVQNRMLAAGTTLYTGSPDLIHLIMGVCTLGPTSSHFPPL